MTRSRPTGRAHRPPRRCRLLPRPLHIGAPYTPATLHIVVRNLSPECATIRSITWNGQLVTDYRIHHNTLIQGGELVFEYEPSDR